MTTKSSYTKVLGLRHPRSAKSSVALCWELCWPSLFLVIDLSYVLHGKVVLRLPLLSAQPRFRNLIKKLGTTTYEIILAPRNISVMSESQRAQSRIFPVTLPWSVSHRASRDINIQTDIKHVTSFLLAKLSSHTVRQSWAKQYVECVFLAMVNLIRLLAHIGYWPGPASSDDFAGRSLASWDEVIHEVVWNLFDKVSFLFCHGCLAYYGDQYLSSGAFRDEISYLVQDLSTSSR